MENGVEGAIAGGEKKVETIRIGVQACIRYRLGQEDNPALDTQCKKDLYKALGKKVIARIDEWNGIARRRGESLPSVSLMLKVEESFSRSWVLHEKKFFKTVEECNKKYPPEETGSLVKRIRMKVVLMSVSF